MGAVTLGFAGVLIVVRPGAGVFGVAAVFPVLSSLAWASAVICTRKLSADDSSTTTTLYSALLGTGALALLLPVIDRQVLMVHAASLGAIAACWCAAQWLTISTYRIAQAASIAPYAYSQLVWASLLGVAVFGHVPDAMSLVGMALAWRAERTGHRRIADESKESL